MVMKMLKGMQFIIVYVVCILSLTINCFHLRSSYSNKHYTNGRDNIPFVINNNYNNVQRIIQSSYNPYHITSLHCQTTSYNDESINGNVKSNDNDNANRSNQLRDILKGSCIFFVGMMGCGKSTIGNIFANKLGYRFLDTDEIAEYMIEMPISDFFNQGRENEFRQLESEILMQMVQYTRVVVSTGGGIVMKNENWGLLRHGVVVFLDLAPDSIYQRLKADPSQLTKRPLLMNLSDNELIEKLKKLREDRIEKYLAADIHLTVPPHASADEVSDLVVTSILQHISDNPPLWKTWKERKEEKYKSMAMKIADGIIEK